MTVSAHTSSSEPTLTTPFTVNDEVLPRVMSPPPDTVHVEVDATVNGPLSDLELDVVNMTGPAKMIPEPLMLPLFIVRVVVVEVMNEPTSFPAAQ